MGYLTLHKIITTDTYTVTEKQDNIEEGILYHYRM